MAKAEASPAPPSTYVTGFCSVGRHERCPAVIKNDVGGRWWNCHCQCHAEGNTGWEPPAMEVNVDAWNAIWHPNGNGHQQWSPVLLDLRDALERAL